MRKQCWTVVTLFLVAPLLLGTVRAGEGNVATETVAKFEDVPMITINRTLFNSSRPRARRLATASVWCISIPNTSDTSLQSSLDWVCGQLANQGQVNCGPINVGGACYDPNTLAHHCDWAFNAYFLRMNAAAGSCDFSGTAQQVTIDPSSGTCVFSPSNVTLNGTTPGASPPTISPLAPNGSPIYSPSAAPGTDWQPHHLFSVSTAVILLTYLST